jgi:hypothetical protein
MQKNQRFHSLFRHYAKYHGLKKAELEYSFLSYLEDDDTPETVQLMRHDVITVQKKRVPIVIENTCNDDDFREDMSLLLVDDEHKDCVFVIDPAVDEEAVGMVGKPDAFSPEAVRRKTAKVEIRAHKSILTARAEYFKGLFRKNTWKDNTQSVGGAATSGVTESVIVVGDEFSVDCVSRMLEWCYTNRIKHLDALSAMELLDLLRLADKWLLKDLKRITEFKLKDLMTVENVARMLCATEDFKALRLQKLCVKYIMDHIKEVTKSNLFREEMKMYPHLCIPILQEAANLIPEPPSKKQRMDVEGEEGDMVE